MLLKILATAAVLLAAWALLFRGLRRPPAPRDRPKNDLEAQTLRKCPSCGIYLPPTGTCGCSDRV